MAGPGRYVNSCPLLRQAPDFFDLAKSCKHLFIFLVDGCSFRYSDKLHEVSVGTVKYDKGIRAGLPAPMLAEVMQLFGSRACPTYVFIGYIRGIVHYVRNVSSSHVVICIGIDVSPKDWRQHVGNTGSFRGFVVVCPVTFLDDLLQFFRRSAFSLHLRGIEEDLQLRLGARVIEGNRVENIISIFCEGPRAAKRIVAGSSDQSVETICPLASHFKALFRVQYIYGRIVSEVRRECAERQLNFQISRQRLDLIGPLRGLLTLCGRCDGKEQGENYRNGLNLCHLSSIDFNPFYVQENVSDGGKAFL